MSDQHGEDVILGAPDLPYRQINFVGPSILHQRPSGIGDDIRFLLFTNLSTSDRSKESLLARSWDTILGEGTINSFAETSLLMKKNKVYLNTGWEATTNHI